MRQTAKYIMKVPEGKRSKTLEDELKAMDVQYNITDKALDRTNEFLYFQLVFPTNEELDPFTFTSDGVINKNHAAMGEKKDDVDYSENLVGMMAYWNVMKEGGRTLKIVKTAKHDTKLMDFW